MKVISVVPTPNPDALKFTVEVTLIKSGSRSFTSQAAAESDTLANSLFEIEGVSSVFYMSDFITVNKKAEITWDQVEPKVLESLKGIVAEEVMDQELKKESSTESVDEGVQFDEMTPAQRILHIDRIFDDEIRPGLAGDGGGLEIVSLDDYVLQIHYEGACGSCPSSVSGTLHYIENLIKSRVDERISVVPV